MIEGRVKTVGPRDEVLQGMIQKVAATGDRPAASEPPVPANRPTVVKNRAAGGVR
jgi:hypothetical protein